MNDTYCQDGAGSMLSAFLPMKVANTSIMYNDDQINL